MVSEPVQGLPHRVPGASLQDHIPRHAAHVDSPPRSVEDAWKWHDEVTGRRLVMGGPSFRAADISMSEVRAFTDAVIAAHHLVDTELSIPMCKCGLPARHCPVVKAQHDHLGIAMPFTFGSLRPPYFEV